MKTSYLFSVGSLYFIIEAIGALTAKRKAIEKHGLGVRLVDFGPLKPLVPIKGHGEGCQECLIFLSKCYC
jgi:hypothetical protein